MWRELDTDVVLLTPEFPGFGGAPALMAPSIDGFADSVAQLIRDEGSPPATVVGLSLGGYVAQSLAVRHPDCVAGLVLANTRAEGDDAAGKDARNRGIDTIRIDGLSTFLDGLLPRLLSPAAPAEVWERVHAIAARQDPDAVCAALEALRDRPDRRDEVSAIAVPTIVVVGRDDAITPREASDALTAAIAGSTQRVLDTGHLSAIEAPAPFAAVIRDALTATAPGRPE